MQVLVQVSLQRQSELGDVRLGDFATPDQISTHRLLLRPQAMVRPFAAPPNIAPDRLKVLQDAFDRTMKDPAFLTDPQNLHLDVSPNVARHQGTGINSPYLPQEVRDKARAAIGG